MIGRWKRAARNWLWERMRYFVFRDTTLEIYLDKHRIWSAPLTAVVEHRGVRVLRNMEIRLCERCGKGVN